MIKHSKTRLVVAIIQLMKTYMYLKRKLLTFETPNNTKKWSLKHIPHTLCIYNTRSENRPTSRLRISLELLHFPPLNVITCSENLLGT